MTRTRSPAIRLTLSGGLLLVLVALQATVVVAGEAPARPGDAAISTARSTATGQRWIAFDRLSGVTQLMYGTWIVAEMRSAWGRGLPGTESDFYSTAPGIYRVYEKRGPLSYNAWFDTYIEAWVAFDPQRFNGFHSLLKDERGRVTDARIGPISAGCVRNNFAWDVYDFAEVGMPVVVHEGSLATAAAALGHETSDRGPGHDELFGGSSWNSCTLDPSEPACFGV